MSRNKTDKPVQIRDFAYVFQSHPEEFFAAKGMRRRIFKQLDDFLTATYVNSPFLLIQGESGIGKTALMANYVCDRRDEIIYYFLEAQRTRLLDSKAFAEHLYFALGWKYALSDSDYDESYYVEHLQKRIQFISENCLPYSKIQSIFIDGLDESSAFGDATRFGSIVDVLNNIEFPDNFRIVISSSREIYDVPGLRTCQRIVMAGSDGENKADVEQYFRDNLPMNNVQENAVDRLVDRSQGNFQYAFLAVKMVKEEEVDIEWLMENPPFGLEGIYDWKLQKIRQRVKDNNAQDNIWKAIRTISLLFDCQTTQTICGILGIDPIHKQDILGPLEQFFDLSAYRIDGICRWHHRSFHDYINDANRFPNRERIKLHRSIVRYMEANIRNCSTLDSCLESMMILRFSSRSLRDHEKRTLFLPDIVRHYCLEVDCSDHSQSWFGNVSMVLHECLLFSRQQETPQQLLFFSLLLYVYARRFGKERSTRMIGRLASDGNARDLGDLRQLHRKDDARSIAVMSIYAYLEGRIPDLRPLMSRVYYLIRREFKNKDKAEIYDLCSKYAEKWFPTDPELALSLSIEGDKKTDEPSDVPRAVYVVHENWKQPVQDLEENALTRYVPGNYDIWIREPASEFYNRDHRLDKTPDARLVRLLKTVLRQAHNDYIPLIDLYKSLWPQGDSARVSHTEARRRKDDIRHALSRCRKLFVDCLHCEWLYDEPFPRIVLQKTFSYCFIEPVVDAG